MAETCCVDGCIKAKDDITFFRFPNSRTQRRKWLEAFATSAKISLESVVCSQHFMAEQYEMVRGKRRLKAKVVPSVFNITNKESTETENPENTKNEAKGLSATDKNPDTTDNGKDKQHCDAPVHRQQNDVKTDSGSYDDDMVKSTQPKIDAEVDSETNKDIEEIITNYHIKQIRPLNREIENRGTERNKPRELIEIEVMGAGNEEIGTGVGNREGSGEAVNGSGEIVDGSEETGKEVEIASDVIDLDDDEEPVFIELSFGKDGKVQESSNQDCLMVLESVQCDVDPASLLPPDPDPDHNPDPDPGSESDVIDMGEKKNDPISLLTSSDEDEVIIQEPKYDLIVVSDEMDEDDVPLVKLANPEPTPKAGNVSILDSLLYQYQSRKSPTQQLSKIRWGDVYFYVCLVCPYRTTSEGEYREHIQEHSTAIQICDICSYITSSKQQFVRHKRKHREERKFKCHLCKYKARHNISLIYHMRCHDKVRLVKSGAFKCKKCKYETNRKKDLVKHVAKCKVSKFVCDKCRYETNRRSDMTRHTRRHRDDDDDEDYVPPK